MAFLRTFTFLACLLPAAIQTNTPVEVVYLANEGVLIRSKNISILIDGLFTPHYPQFASPDSLMLASMMNGNDKFLGLDYHLITHCHKDHYNPELLSEQLIRQANLTIISTKQVRAQLDQKSRKRVKTKGTKDRKNDLSIGVIRIKHINPDFSDIENFAYLIKIGDKKLLHLGDAAINQENLDLIPKGDIDLVILPYFVLNDEKNTERFLEKLGDPVLMISHIQSDYIDNVKSQIPSALPGVKTVVPGTPYEVYKLD